MLSLIGRPLFAGPPGADLAKLEADLASARAVLAERPDDAAAIIWVGRRLGYLWRVREAIDVYTEGFRHHPKDARLYRHRGHRFITLRRFNRAIVDLERAVGLIRGQAEEIEPDGMPNAQGIPLTTTAFNVWYHLGLAHYLEADFDEALAAFGQAMAHTRGFDDNVVAVTDWMSMSMRRMGRHAEAAALLDPITPDMTIIENHAYHRRLLMYKGLIGPGDLLDVENASDLDLATLGYGLGNWYLCNGDEDKAVEVFDRITSGPYWPAFGFIAAESDLTRLRR